jgi:hypothetical protein
MRDGTKGKTMTLRASLTIFADYHQIYICDPAHLEDWSDLWTDQTVADRIVACEHTVVFGAGRNMAVPVDVMTHSASPDWPRLLSGADHAVSAALKCTSGTLKVAGLTDYLPSAFALDIGKGLFGVAFVSFALATIDDLDGSDRYELHLWPVAEPFSPRILVRYAG